MSEGSPSLVAFPASFELTEQERLVFAELRQVVDVYQLGTVLRVAGGWVRDKLLGRASDDIDVALDNIGGEAFAHYIEKYHQEISHEELSSSLAVIRTNPEQSKHLETARMRVQGIEIDLVNLRSEEYATNSRIPTIVCGTPKQDAERRDLTLNALFLNISSNPPQVEDWLGGRGISDLQHMIARTPLAPYVTFCDDPLRVLRTLRFTARYNLNIESETAESMVNPFVCLRLGSIVSRERIGVEISGLVRGDYAQSVLENYVLNEKGIFLLNAVFQCGTSCWRGIDIDLSIRALSAVNQEIRGGWLLQNGNHHGDLACEKSIVSLAAISLPQAMLRSQQTPLSCIEFFMSRSQQLPPEVIVELSQTASRKGPESDRSSSYQTLSEQMMAVDLSMPTRAVKTLGSIQQTALKMMRACIILRDNWAADEARIFLYHSFIECGSPVFFVAAAILAKAMIIMAVDYMNRGSPCLNFYPPFVRTDDVNSYFYSLPLSESIENLLQANMDTVQTSLAQFTDAVRQFSLTDWCSVRPCIRGNELLNEVNGLLKSSGRSPLHPASTSALVHGLTLAQVIGKVTGVNEAKAWVGHNLDHIVQIAESFYNQSRANRQSKAKSR